VGPKVLRQWTVRCAQGQQPVHVVHLLQEWEAHPVQKNKRLQTPLNTYTVLTLYSKV